MKTIIVAFGLLAAGSAIAQTAFSTTEIRITPLSGSVSIIVVPDANIGLLKGPDAILVIDNPSASLAVKVLRATGQLSLEDGPAADKTLEALRDAYLGGRNDEAIEITANAVRKAKLRLFVLNTHWHPDQTGGNRVMVAAGASILAHENVRRRMKTGKALSGQRLEGLPIRTFSDKLMLRLNGDEILVFHVPDAHTDGDVIVHFKKAGVLFLGNTFVNGAYPLIDVAGGGTIDGLIAAQKKALALAGRNTKIVPGHGSVGDRAALQSSYEMLAKARDAIARAAANGGDCGQADRCLG